MYGAQKCFDKFISLSVSYMPPQKHYCLLSLIWLNAILIILEVFLKFIWKLWCELKKKKRWKKTVAKKKLLFWLQCCYGTKTNEKTCSFLLHTHTHTHTLQIRCVRYITYIQTPHTHNLGSRGKIDENFT